MRKYVRKKKETTNLEVRLFSGGILELPEKPLGLDGNRISTHKGEAFVGMKRRGSQLQKALVET